MKKLLLLLSLLLPLTASAQPSADTYQHYLRYIGSWTNVVNDSNNGTFEVPSWATGAVVWLETSNCVGCTILANFRLYWPGTSTAWTPVWSDSNTANEWTATLIYSSYTVGDSDWVMDRNLIYLPPGTVYFFINHTAGSADVELWIQWLGNPKR